jgi:hypothetical protein
VAGFLKLQGAGALTLQGKGDLLLQSEATTTAAGGGTPAYVYRPFPLPRSARTRVEALRLHIRLLPFRGSASSSVSARAEVLTLSLTARLGSARGSASSAAVAGAIPVPWFSSRLREQQARKKVEDELLALGLF